MTAEDGHGIAVADFRRRGMILAWRPSNATWTALETPPALVHGVALIRGAPPNVCLYALDGRLILQIGEERYPLEDRSPRLRARPDLLTLGLRRRFSLLGEDGGRHYVHAYWRGTDGHFFSWVSRRAGDAAWRRSAATAWSAGVEPATIRQSQG